MAGTGDEEGEAVPGCVILLQLDSQAADFSSFTAGDLVLDFPAAPGAAQGILRVCPTQVEASLLPSLRWASAGTGHGECPGLAHSGTSACLSYSWVFLQKREIIF